MRFLRVTLAVACLAAWACSAVADPNQGQAGPRPQLGTNPNPIIWGGQPAKPQPAPQPPPAKPAPPVTPPAWAYGRYIVGGYAPYVGGACGYDPYTGYQYPYVYPPISGTYYLPPVLSDDIFGPGAAQRFVAPGDQSRPKPNAGIFRDDDANEPKRGAERGTNAQALARAGKFLSYGDARFAKQEYLDANDRYREASRSAPQLADAWFRQGFALVAIGRYDAALAAIRRGLKLDPKWAKSDFTLRDLYGPDPMPKDAHRDELAEAAEANPNDADLLLLLGIHLYFDGQAQRAKTFFDRARELGSADVQLLNAFAPN